MIPKNQMKFPKIKRERSLKSLIHTLDRLFSEYIRRRDSDTYGMCHCVTCGATFHWKSGDCGHFVQRDRMAVRFEEKNVAAQCTYCNRFRNGKQYEFGQAIDRRWGRGTAEQLILLGKMRGAKIDRATLEIKIAEYRSKLKGVEQN